MPNHWLVFKDLLCSHTSCKVLLNMEQVSFSCVDKKPTERELRNLKRKRDEKKENKTKTKHTPEDILDGFQWPSNFFNVIKRIDENDYSSMAGVFNLEKIREMTRVPTAFNSHHIWVLRAIIDPDMDVNDTRYNIPVLRAAVICGNVKALELLLRFRPDILDIPFGFSKSTALDKALECTKIFVNANEFRRDKITFGWRNIFLKMAKMLRKHFDP